MLPDSLVDRRQRIASPPLLKKPIDTSMVCS
ncbi:hypothetical protein SAMN05443572_10488 [Myxococcus fulvus]|uniref:Uncharacterized protein n=1 Tax=Myxococcus fulvus TaxID=33 RepID=A0ABY1CE98_MYXFU|nr:hypothetical protein SAMN05443572_10488 [Myxococcus fulvus]